MCTYRPRCVPRGYRYNHTLTHCCCDSLLCCCRQRATFPTFTTTRFMSSKISRRSVDKRWCIQCVLQSFGVYQWRLLSIYFAWGNAISKGYCTKWCNGTAYTLHIGLILHPISEVELLQFPPSSQMGQRYIYTNRHTLTPHTCNPLACWCSIIRYCPQTNTHGLTG